MKKNSYKRKMILVYKTSRMIIFLGLSGTVILLNSTGVSKFNANRYSNRIEKAKEANASLTKELSEVSAAIMSIETAIQQNQEKVDRYKDVEVPDSMKQSIKASGGNVN